MNKIYKTICRKFDGKTIVVFELTKNQGQRQNQVQRDCTCALPISISMILFTALGSSALAQPLTYDDTGTIML